MVFDVTDSISFQNVAYWLKKVKKHGDENVEIILLGNKIDLINDKAVQSEEAEALAASFGIQYFETCAKNATNVDTAFKFLLSKIANNEYLQEKIKIDSSKQHLHGLSQIRLEPLYGEVRENYYIAGGGLPKFPRSAGEDNKTKCCAIGLFQGKKEKRKGSSDA